MPESALIIAVPEAEPLVKAWRDQFDSSAAAGVPAHITILYPFVPPQMITSEVLVGLREFFAQFAEFEFTLPELRRFPDVLYLAPSPAEPFKALISAVVENYPDYPPYGGAIAEVIPHLTIADVDEAAQLDAIEREFMQQHGAQLPVSAKSSKVLLIENTSGRWETRHAFELSKSGRQEMKTAKHSDWQTQLLPLQRSTVSLDRRFTAHEIQRMRLGPVPEEMEDKWFVYWDDDVLFFHRSWTGNCIYIVRFAAEGDSYRMVEADVNRDPEQYNETSDDLDVRMISYLIDVLLLKRDAEFPREEQDPERKALTKWSQVGRAMLGQHPKNE